MIELVSFPCTHPGCNLMADDRICCVCGEVGKASQMHEAARGWICQTGGCLREYYLGE